MAVGSFPGLVPCVVHSPGPRVLSGVARVALDRESGYRGLGTSWPSLHLLCDPGQVTVPFPPL